MSILLHPTNQYIVPGGQAGFAPSTARLGAEPSDGQDNYSSGPVNAKQREEQATTYLCWATATHRGRTERQGAQLLCGSALREAASI